VERVVPSDDTPGAREAGTAAYVLGRAGVTSAVRAGYVRLAARLEAEATARATGGTFAALSPEAQDDILAGLDREADGAFRRLVVDTMEGFYGDPRHGGNANGVGWANIGFPGPTGGSGYEPPLGWYDEHTEDLR
jgi:gluconate 2-dehydrogenase gamma chain